MIKKDWGISKCGREEQKEGREEGKAKEVDPADFFPDIDTYKLLGLFDE